MSTLVYDGALLTDPSRRVWSRGEAGAALGISQSAVDRLARAACIPYAKRGPGDHVFDAAAILPALATEAERKL